MDVDRLIPSELAARVMTAPVAATGLVAGFGVAVASGHFRNGMLLAPHTAAAMVALLAPSGPRSASRQP